MAELKSNVASFHGSCWTVGTKDDLVYWELWNPDKTIKIADGTLDHETARQIGEAFIEKSALSASLSAHRRRDTNPTTSGAPRAAGAAETTQGQQP